LDLGNTVPIPNSGIGKIGIGNFGNIAYTLLLNTEHNKSGQQPTVV
jgi:hypothetical protein